MVCLNCKYIETTFVSDYIILFDERGNKEELSQMSQQVYWFLCTPWTNVHLFHCIGFSLFHIGPQIYSAITNVHKLHLDQTSNKRLENRPLSWQRVFKSADSLISSIHKLISGVTTLLRSAGNCLPERRRDESVLPDLFLTSWGWSLPWTTNCWNTSVQ